MNLKNKHLPIFLMKIFWTFCHHGNAYVLTIVCSYLIHDSIDLCTVLVFDHIQRAKIHIVFCTQKTVRSMSIFANLYLCKAAPQNCKASLKYHQFYSHAYLSSMFFFPSRLSPDIEHVVALKAEDLCEASSTRAFCASSRLFVTIATPLN